MLSSSSQQQLGLNDFDKLNVVHTHFQRSEPFSFDVFEGFSTLRVLTYSSSIPMTVRMLSHFDSVECIFGYEGVIKNFSEILAVQKTLSDDLLFAIKGLEDDRKAYLVEQMANKRLRFLLVKDAISHSKIYLLESDSRRRVIAGSANFSERAFSGKQIEELILFDDDDPAWEYYESRYEAVRSTATSDFHVPDLAIDEVRLEDTPLVAEAKGSTNGITVLLPTDNPNAVVSTIVKKVEVFADKYKNIVNPIAKPVKGRITFTAAIRGKIIQLAKAQKQSVEMQEPTWLSINRDTDKILLSGRELSLDVQKDQLKSDVNSFIEYFGNFEKGFHGNVKQLQKDYFMFMNWFYLSPLICDLRNHAISENIYIYDFPMFAVLFGKSNCGKTSLVRTLMKSMFGEWEFVEKESFTARNLRGLFYAHKRYPVIFDDVDRARFMRHGPDIIKDETLMLEEYPPFILSMNAESHSFSTEIIKRCLMIYTNSSLPDNADQTRDLYSSVTSIQDRLSTDLYSEFLTRVLAELREGPYPSDILDFASKHLISIFEENCDGDLPPWCKRLSIRDYHSKKYDRVQLDLRKLYDTNPGMWDIRKDEIILRVSGFESSGIRRDIPDWLLKPGSRVGNIVMDRHPLEEFLDMKFRSKWRRTLRI